MAGRFLEEKLNILILNAALALALGIFLRLTGVDMDELVLIFGGWAAALFLVLWMEYRRLGKKIRQMEAMVEGLDKKYLVFGNAFGREFVGQKETDNRSINETLDIGWRLLGLLPKDELDRVDTKILDKYYRPAETD